ncbi:hypothetical protein F2Q69_00040250 [Brassica cretica]|uniref:FKB95-like N-terminal Kelch domain-containing protein n=1 Tax=Brassica cretica TaxID=69181 RepID=A0A8S9NJ75_BRACR|nr:hypothetical protein F2Q69_00040250 [Brassica cretica]
MFGRGRSCGWLVAVGSDIYNIATHLRGGVSILDCISNTWCKAPSMPVELESLSAEVLDRKIYVLGRSYHHQDGSLGSPLLWIGPGLRDGDCWGKLEWYDSVLSVPEFVKVLAVTL